MSENQASLPSPVVDPEWLAGHLAEPNLVVVDASWYLPAMARDPKAEYQAGHLPGAIFWDLDALSEQDTGLPHMLPSPETFARQVGALGIGNDDRVVVYDGSGTNLSAPRVWWELRAFGHDRVAVLDGGLAGWRAKGYATEGGIVRRDPTRFVARPRPELVISLEQVTAAIGSGSAQLLDARSAGRFAAREPEPRPGIRGGHLPGSRNLPFGELVDASGRLRSAAELRALFGNAGVDLDRPVITSCGSGVSACALALALAAVGHRDAAVYDGSWTEWGGRADTPIDTGPPTGA
ncbi:MAG: 3-mercaptopyruvate sulfurtransferase [Gemmatimonadales bacterium]